jgi:hypothetical protein
MKSKIAALIFICVCILLAILLVMKAISPLVSGSIFALALIIFGGLSKGFRKV